LATAFADIKAEINNRFEVNAVGIVAPEGPVQIHMDYIASSMVNAFAFYFDKWYFIGITDGMLELFAKSCTALWRLNPLAKFLGIDPVREKRDSIFQFVLLLELQYISNHELGHMFHGHCTGLREGHYRAEFDVATLVANSIGMEGQARELEADGYAISLLLKNLLQSDSAAFMHCRVQSTKSVREFVVTLFLLSLAATLYHVKSAPFDAAKVRSGDHSDGLIRMNILLGEILGWCTDNIAWKDAVSQDDFQSIMELIVVAVANPMQEQIWRDQGAYLLTDEGREYLNDIYKRRINLRLKMSSHHWRLSTEVQPPNGDFQPPKLDGDQE
jgi:hypothetical protein